MYNQCEEWRAWSVESVLRRRVECYLPASVCLEEYEKIDIHNIHPFGGRWFFFLFVRCGSTAAGMGDWHSFPPDSFTVGLVIPFRRVTNIWVCHPLHFEILSIKSFFLLKFSEGKTRRFLIKGSWFVIHKTFLNFFFTPLTERCGHLKYWNEIWRDKGT